MQKKKKKVFPQVRQAHDMWRRLDAPRPCPPAGRRRKGTHWLVNLAELAPRAYARCVWFFFNY